MQYLVTARDGTDPEANTRREAAKSAHSAMVRRLVSSGNLLFGVATNDDEGRPVGSAMVFEFETRAQLDEQLEREPYVVNNVWEQVEVVPCTVGESFEWTLLEAGAIRLDGDIADD